MRHNREKICSRFLFGRLNRVILEFRDSSILIYVLKNRIKNVILNLRKYLLLCGIDTNIKYNLVKNVLKFIFGRPEK